MKTTIKKWCSIFFIASILIGAEGCQPEETDSGNGLSDPNVDATFTVSPDPTSANKFILVGNSENVLQSSWIVDGIPYEGLLGLPKNIFLPDAGTYTVTYNVIGRGGITNSSSQQIVVATSDPIAGNLVVDGKFTTPANQDAWEVLNISASGTSWAFNIGSSSAAGSATLSGGGWNQQGIYQAIQVEAGRQYKLDMQVSGTAAVNTWFEVYVSPTAPVQGSDYSADGRRMGLSTWDGCATGTYNGLLSEVGCVGSGNILEFPNSGTVYLVIKGGGENLGANGITITNVEFRGVAE
jgi:hypothetical protein